jgi:hypothetical protein
MLTIEEIYTHHCSVNTAISVHLPRLLRLADGLDLAVEFGVKRGASSSALLCGAARVMSFDIASTPEARELKRIAGEKWDYRIADSRTADVPPCDLLFIDSQHDYEQCAAELEAHADKVRHFLAFHDTITFGSVGAAGESGEHKWQYKRGQSCPAEALGIRPAIDELMVRDPSWRIMRHYPDSHGLLILRRP